MKLRLIGFKEAPKKRGDQTPKEIVNVHEKNCGKVYRKDGKFNAATQDLFNQAVYDLFHETIDEFKLIQIKKN